MTLPVAILAGGLATRLRPLTEKIPKALVDVAGKPFIEWQLELLRRNGLDQVVLCVGYLGEMVEAALGTGEHWGMDLKYVHDGKRLLGTGGALRKALPLLGEGFFVLYGDSYLECDYARVEEAFLTSQKSGLLTLYRNDNRWDRSNTLFSNGSIIRYDKRHPTSDMRHIDYGLGVLKAKVVETYPADTPIDLTTIYQDLIARGDLGGYEVTKRFYEVGSKQGLEEIRRYLSS